MSSEPAPAVTPKSSALNSVGGLIGAAGGWALSQYSGMSLWLPGAVTVILLLVFTKTALRPKYFVGAISVTGGHIAWFVAGSAILGNWSTAGLDIVMLLLAVVALWWKPGRVTAVILGLFQLGSLALNVFQITHAEIGSLPHRALTVHCVWRLLALVCLVFGYLKLRKDQAVARTPPPLPAVM